MASPVVVAPVGERRGRNGEGGGKDSELLEHVRPPFELSAAAFHAPGLRKQTDKVQHV
jgi:hypothetical protein